MRTIKSFVEPNPGLLSLILIGALGYACDGGNGDGNDSDTGEPTDTEPARVWECVAEPGDEPDYLNEIGCEADFETVAATPADSSLPGALSVKTVVDRYYDNALYFQNSNLYRIHYDFASAHLSGGDMEYVPPWEQFNLTEYTTLERRFLLGAVTYYEGPDAWVYEIAGYDNANAEMIETAFDAIKGSVFFGSELYFHPTSVGVEGAASDLPESIPIITTEELYAGIDYQALNLGTSLGRITFVTAKDLSHGTYVAFRDIAVLDAVPNDISVVMGIITGEFQTPLSHVNVLSQNRNTPNMALRGAFENETLRDLDGKWVRLTVGPFEWSVEEVAQEEADEWWDDYVGDDEVQVPRINEDITELTDIEDILDMDLPLKEALDEGIPAFGGKATHFSGLARIPEAQAPKAFAIPIYYYLQFMRENGFDVRVDELLQDAEFTGDPAVRDAALEELRNDMLVAPVNQDFLDTLIDKLNTEYPGVRMRFRSSTNAEDLDGFTGAGLYTSRSGDPNDPEYPVEDALRTVWSSVWFFRAFEERSFRNISHTDVGMAILVHHSFPDEEANGVALTANPFDTSGLEPGYYINVQVGEMSVVQPLPGITTDQFIYQYDMSGQPIIFIDHSNLVATGSMVLTNRQIYDLGTALKAIHAFFYEAYGPPLGATDAWYAMDVEFKFDGEPGEEPLLSVKQARPHPGR